jgi:hypothetical protein
VTYRQLGRTGGPGVADLSWSHESAARHSKRIRFACSTPRSTLKAATVSSGWSTYTPTKSLPNDRRRLQTPDGGINFIDTVALTT